MPSAWRPPAPEETGAQQILYHYTNGTGLKGINDSESLNASIPDPARGGHNADRASSMPPADELMRAYMRAGVAIFEKEPGKYLRFLKSRALITA